MTDDDLEAQLPPIVEWVRASLCGYGFFRFTFPNGQQLVYSPEQVDAIYTTLFWRRRRFLHSFSVILTPDGERAFRLSRQGTVLLLAKLRALRELLGLPKPPEHPWYKRRRLEPASDEEFIRHVRGVRIYLETLASITPQSIVVPGGPEALLEALYVMLGFLEERVDALRAEVESRHQWLDATWDAALASAIESEGGAEERQEARNSPPGEEGDSVTDQKRYEGSLAADSSAHVTVNGLPLRIIDYYTDQVAWGYVGSGPAELALSILADYFDEGRVSAASLQGLQLLRHAPRAWYYHRLFQHDVVADWPREQSWRLTSEEIAAWLALQPPYDPQPEFAGYPIDSDFLADVRAEMQALALPVTGESLYSYISLHYAADNYTIEIVQQWLATQPAIAQQGTITDAGQPEIG